MCPRETYDFACVVLDIFKRCPLGPPTIVLLFTLCAASKTHLAVFVAGTLTLTTPVRNSKCSLSLRRRGLLSPTRKRCERDAKGSKKLAASSKASRDAPSRFPRLFPNSARREKLLEKLLLRRSKKQEILK